MQECKLTFGRLLWNARRNRRISQRDLCKIISNEYNHSIDCYDLSKIENDQLEVQSMAFRPASYEYNWLIPIIAEIFNVNVEWLEQIRQQTEPQPLDSRCGNVSDLLQFMKYKATRAGRASRDPAQLHLDSERGASQLVNKNATFFHE